MDKLQKFQYTMDSCNHCGQCKWIMPAQMHGWDFSECCPVHARFGFDAYSGQGYINIAKEVLAGTLSYGEGLEEMLGTCTLCGACDVNCKSVRDMEVLDTILALREDAAHRGTLPEEWIKTAENIEKTKNIYGEDPAKRFDWLPEDYEDDPEADTALFIGCNAAYRHPEIARAAVEVLKALDIPFTLLYEDEGCCGIHLWQAGLTEAFEETVLHHIEAWKKRGIKRVITACAECFGAFRGGYPRVAETPFEIVHISQAAAEKIRKKKVSLHPVGISGKVTWHDPCLLGRRSEEFVPWDGEIQAYGLHVPPKVWRRGEFGVYEEPREVLSAIPDISLVEMPRHAEAAWCCGGGQACNTDPELTEWTGKERRREAASTEAGAIVTACPFCEDALSGADPDGIPVYDLTVLLASAVAGKEVE